MIRASSLDINTAMVLGTALLNFVAILLAQRASKIAQKAVTDTQTQAAIDRIIAKAVADRAKDAADTAVAAAMSQLHQSTTNAAKLDVVATKVDALVKAGNGNVAQYLNIETEKKK